MRRLDQLSKGIQKSRIENDLNTRRAQANFPLVERKLDIVSLDYNFAMDFPLTKHDHSTFLTLKIKPDNCCECDPGAQAPMRSTIAYYFQSIVPVGFTDRVDYPAIYAAPLIQNNSTFSYGWGLPSPLSVHLYEDYGPLGETSIDEGIVIAEDGVYTIYFQAVIDGGSVGGPDSEIIASIRRITTDEDTGEELNLLLSKKIYSVARGNLSSGSHIHHLINLDNMVAWTLRVYATCVNLNAGDIVGGYIQATNIPNLSTFYGWSDLNNSTRINLLGLGYGILIGFVYDQDGVPLQGATVSYTLGFGGSTTTDEFGAYGFYTLRPATYNLTASKASYYAQTRMATVYFNKITQIDFTIEHV